MNTEFDLKNFQSEVFNDFNAMKATFGLANFYLKDYKSIENGEETFDVSFSPIGLFTKGVIKFFSFLGKRADKNILNQPDFIEKEKRAIKIVNDPKIKRILCQAFRKEIWTDLFKEGIQVKTVKVVTARLTEKNIFEGFSIEKDVRLFSLITYKILQKKGRYCS